MKLHHLFERMSQDATHPFSVQYEIESDDPNVRDRIVVVSGDVGIESDPFATGDSPTAATFLPKEIVDKQTGEQVPFDAIDQAGWRWIQDQATEAMHN